jgi:hypothetical protein
VFRGFELRALVGDESTAALLLPPGVKAWRVERPTILQLEADWQPNNRGGWVEWLIWKLPIGVVVRRRGEQLEAFGGGDGSGVH